MTTRFERALGYSLETNLRRAVCCHKSIHSPLEATRRYGWDQESLAAYGDRLVLNFLRLYQAKYPGRVLNLGLYVSNRFMDYYVHDMGLARYMRHGLDVDQSHEHEYGTFFEAILAALHITHGPRVSRAWVEEYARAMSTLEYLDVGHTLDYHRAWLGTDATSQWSQLSDLLARDNRYKRLTLRRFSPHGPIVALGYQVREFDEQWIIRRVIGNGASLPAAIEHAASRALGQITCTGQAWV